MISPPKDSTIIFREPYPMKRFSGHTVKYYIRVSIDGGKECEVCIRNQKQQDLIDYLIKVDLKLTSAVVRNDTYGRFTVLRHSPQIDFFEVVE